MKACMYAGGEGVLESREMYTGGRRGLKFSVFIVYVLYGWPLKVFYYIMNNKQTLKRPQIKLCSLKN